MPNPNHPKEQALKKALNEMVIMAATLLTPAHKCDMSVKRAFVNAKKHLKGMRGYDVNTD